MQPILEVARRLGIHVVGNMARCPYPDHEDSNPSFSIYPATNSCWCHRCGLGGSVIDLVSLSQGITVGEAIRWLRSNHGTPTLKAYRQSQGLRGNSPAAKSGTNHQEFSASPEIYDALLQHCPIDEQTTRYLVGRGFTKATIEHFQVGSLNDPRATALALVSQFGRNAVYKSGLLRGGAPMLSLPGSSAIFPFFVDGVISYLQVRALPGAYGPRWSGPRGVAKLIFNFDVIFAARSIYICEGVTDVLAAHQQGLAAIGLLGGKSTLPARALHALKGKAIYIVPDKDEVGEAMASRLKSQLRRVGLTATTKRLDTGADVSENLMLKRHSK